MKKLAVFLAVFAFMVSGGLLFASGNHESKSATAASSGAQTSIQMWIAGNPVTKPIYVGEADAFSQSHPGVKVSVTDLPGPAFTEKLNTALAAGQPPAIYQLFGPGPQMRTLVQGNKLANLNALVASGSSLKDRVIPAALQQGRLNGVQYGIPYNIFQEAVIFYNKSAFKKAGIAGVPTTWPEFMTDVAKLKSAGIIPISIAGAENNNWYGWWLENYEVRLGGQSVTQSIKNGDLSALNSSSVVEAAKAMQDLVKAGAFEPGYTTTSEANNIPYAYLGTGKAGMLMYGAFVPNFIQQVTPNFIKNGDMGWFSFPSVPGGADNQVVDLSSTPQLVVNANMSASNIKLAEDFLKYFVYSPAQVKALAQTGNVGPAAQARPVVAQYAPAALKSYMLFQLDEALQAKQSFIGWGNLIPTSTTSTWNSLKEKLFSLTITPAQFAAQASKM